MKTKILADFQICISVPLTTKTRFLFSQKLSILCFPLNVSVFVQVHFRMQIIKSDTLT